MKITAKEFAAQIGVSQSTVSMVYNGKPGVSEQTKKLVLESAQKIGYVPKQKHRSASEARTIQYVIYKKHGSVVSETSFFSSLLQGLEARAKELGYTLIISYFYENMYAAEQTNALLGSAASGIVLLATEMEEQNLNPFLQLNKPLVILDSYIGGDKADSITINNAAGAFDAVSFLYKNGHRKIGYLSSRVKINNFSERAEGFYKALHACPLADQHPIVIPVGSTTESAYRDMKIYLNQGGKLPTAFFADNDIIAVSCIRALKEHGCRLPEDVSIIGFDDMPMCDLTEPPLTTIRVHKHLLGNLAVSLVDRRLKIEEPGNFHVEVSTQLVERSSVRKLT